MRSKSKEERVKLTVHVGLSVRETIERLQVDTGSESLSEVFRRALTAYEFIVQQEKNGVEVLLDDGEDLRRLLVL
jgi:hypothetical protein